MEAPRSSNRTFQVRSAVLRSSTRALSVRVGCIDRLPGRQHLGADLVKDHGSGLRAERGLPKTAWRERVSRAGTARIVDCGLCEEHPGRRSGGALREGGRAHLPGRGSASQPHSSRAMARRKARPRRRPVQHCHGAGGPAWRDRQPVADPDTPLDVPVNVDPVVPQRASHDPQCDHSSPRAAQSLIGVTVRTAIPASTTLPGDLEWLVQVAHLLSARSGMGTGSVATLTALPTAGPGVLILGVPGAHS